jgi:hypothetical protein
LTKIFEILTFPKKRLFFYTDFDKKQGIWAKKISHNVPAVYDVLPARIRAPRSGVQGWQNVPE